MIYMVWGTPPRSPGGGGEGADVKRLRFVTERGDDGWVGRRFLSLSLSYHSIIGNTTSHKTV